MRVGDVVAWLRRRDEGWRATRRALRTAIVMPAAFAVGVRTGDSQTATFAAFGSFALLLLFDPPGPRYERFLSYLSLVGLGTVNIVVATLCARTTVSAVLGMAVVAFAVLMLAALGSEAAGATTALLLTFILPVSLPITMSELPGRLAGWGIAAAAAVPAALLLWPPGTSDPLRRAAAAACREIGHLLRVAGRLDGDEPEAAASARVASSRLQAAFSTAPARPGGAGEADRALAVLVDELDWVALLADDVATADATRSRRPNEIRDELAIAGELLTDCGHVLDDVRDGPAGQEHDAGLRDRMAQLAVARATAADASFARLDVTHVTHARHATEAARITTAVPATSLTSADDISFAAHAIGFGVQSVAEHVLQVRAASGWQGLAGWRRWRRAAWQALRERLQPGSPVLRAGIRGAVALGASVWLTAELDVQRGFWVILGTLSVLRSTAVGTGATALRAVAGTAAGFVIGAAVVVGLGTRPPVLWALLPIAVFAAGVTPAMVSFAVGQAAFTVVIVILFNILLPTGWRVGLLRIEDVALGCAVSVAVGVLFWPRGVLSGFGAALDEAYAAGADRLRRIVLVLTGAAEAAPGAARRVATARRRLDDAFRLFLAERGTQRVPLRDATNLAAAATRLRLLGDSLADLAGTMPTPVADGVPETRLREAAGALDLWYRELGDAVAGRRPDVPEPEEPDPRGAATLLAGLRDADADGSDVDRRRALMVLWTAQHLDRGRRQEAPLTASATVLAEARGGRPWT